MKKALIFAVVLGLVAGMASTAMATAETLTSTRATSGATVYGVGNAGNLKVARATYEIAANVEAGDIFEMVKLPAGATVVGGMVYGDDLDTGAEALEMDLGWAANGGSGTYDSVDADGLGDFGIWTGDTVADHAVEVGNVFHITGNLANGDLPTFTKTTTVQLTAVAAATTFAAGAVSVVIHYTMDD